MTYIPHTPEEIEPMLERIGVARIEELFETVPASLRRRAELKLPAPLAERTLLAHLRLRASENVSSGLSLSFLGAGAYHHFVPSVVDAVAGRGEFTTAYTPYQAEISQGTLQAIFEFQTLMCQLTALEVSNASLYDGASAAAETALMAMRITRRKRICVSAGVHPHYIEVIRGIDGRILL